ncbi:glycosyltransferase family 2 protein [Rhodoferax sp.]|uniref:glycosyltransferase family 2 protein n=1 Tax=Rhodoferax sp. TaxID=50421 RepID=UPI00260EED26|nr:glycosyltransferase family 2 protein [Rhodoferax sp.]MDD2926178.1 glycosyltransferase family 2 protein [Rhodoferax sp.]
MSLSVIIITRNEAANIRDCLRGLDFANEVIVLDYASTDGTAEMARSLGATVHVTQDWPGFGPQKNRVLAMAQGDWVLSLDADERVPTDLREEILAAISREDAAAAYELPRLSSYCGQFIRHSGWSPDYVLRLFRRGQARFSDDLVHEKVLATGRVGQLKTPLLHLSFPDFESVLDKMNRYSSAGAQSMARRGVQSSLLAALGHGLWAFIRTYVIRRGFLDGQLGLALAISNAEGTYYRYAKRWLTARQRDAQS